MSLHTNSYSRAMEKEPPHNRQISEHEELIVLLRSLRIEATAEAHFEERFVYDFHERLVHEAVSRSARSLMWEHILHILDNIGGRRLAWSLSSFGVGALCMGVLFWQHGGAGKRALASQEWALGGSAPTLRPGASQDVVCTSVQHSKRKAFTERLMAARLSEPTYLAAEDDAEAPAYYFSTSTAAEDIGPGISIPGLAPHLAH